MSHLEAESPVVRGGDATAIVTGGSRGIGAQLVRRLAAENWKIAFSYRSHDYAAQKLAEEIADQGGDIRAFKADFLDSGAAAPFVGEVVEWLGSIDLLVNNAGTAAFSALGAITREHMLDQYMLNAVSPTLIVQAAMPHLRDGGRVVNVSSLAASGPFPGNSGYGASKAALEQLTRIWAVELGPRQITVNCVSPGPVETDLYFEAGRDVFADAQRAATPLGRIGQPDDIAGAIIALAARDSGWITGQIIQASGGMRR